MKKLLGCGFMAVFLALAGLFAYQWNRTAATGAGTGRIAARDADSAAHRAPETESSGASNLARVAQHPAQYAGKTLTVKGRVRGPLRLASNRTVYRLVDESGKNSLLVVDDREPPKEYWARSITGRVQLLKAPVGDLQYPYIVSLEEDVRYDLKWDEVKSFFADKLQDVEHGAKSVAKRALR